LLGGAGNRYNTGTQGERSKKGSTAENEREGESSGGGGGVERESGNTSLRKKKKKTALKRKGETLTATNGEKNRNAPQSFRRKLEGKRAGKK